MRLTVLAVGRPSSLLADAIAEYERRAARYWTLDIIDVREEKASRGTLPESVRSAESERLRQRVPAGAELLALTRTGDGWSSSRLAGYLEDLALHGRPGAAFAIGGALGLSGGLIAQARHRLSLSALTFPHDMARLLLLEQLYRAGTILRGEPYHKTTE